MLAITPQELDADCYLLCKNGPGILSGGGGLLQLVGGEPLGHGLRSMLGLLPIGAVVADIVGGGRVPQFPARHTRSKPPPQPTAK